MIETREFHLDGEEYIELKNLLKVLGLCRTGGGAKIAVELGEVKVDGVKELRKACKIRAGQTVAYEGTHIKVLP